MKLDYHIFKSALNGYLASHIGGSQRPVFHDIEKTCPQLQQLIDAFPEIRAEFDALLASETELPCYHDIDSGEREISATTQQQWNVFLLEILGHRPDSNRARCPRTCAVLQRIPRLVQAFFSILEPGKSIPQHEGPYFGYLRFHLALRVPTDDPPRLIINEQPYVWSEGAGVLFDDSWPHRVENDSRQWRAVLVVDVMRPMPWLPDLVNRMATQGVARHTYGRAVSRKAAQFASTPPRQHTQHTRRAA